MRVANKTFEGLKFHSWKPQLPDHRDFRFKMPSMALPRVVESIARGARIHDQGYTNSCTGHAGTTALEVALGRTGDLGQLSRLMAYYHAREYIGETKVDEGAYIRDIFRGFLAKGVAPETNWRFTTTNLTRTPTATAMKYAEKLRQEVAAAGLVYESIRTLDEIKGALATNLCVVFGFTVYNSIFTLNSQNYTLPFPGAGEQPIGGHAVLADGYNDDLGVVYVQNSWGATWGNKGYFNMPYQWFTDPNYLTGDFWTCRRTK